MFLLKPNNLHPHHQQRKLLSAGLVSLLALIISPVSAGPALHWQQHALGATLQLELQGVSAAEFATQQPLLQQKLTTLSQQLDADIAESALSQLNTHGTLPAENSVLLQLLNRCEEWYQQHRGYSCRLGSIHQQWQRAEQQGQLPDRVLLRQQSRQLQQLSSKDALQNRHIHWNLSGLDQAFLLDQLQLWCRQLFPKSTQLRLQLGDVTLSDGAAYALQLPWQPGQKTNVPLLQINLQHAALAYSKQQGGYKLSYRSYSPLLHPDEGWPVEYGPQVAVVANTAVEAWLLAQSLALLPADKHPDLLTASHGTLPDPTQQSLIKPPAALLNIATANSSVLQPSSQWYHLLADPQPWQPQAALQLNYQIRQQPVAAKRPYLAIWISTKDQQLVRQLSLQGQQSRWYQELRQWWRRIGKPATWPIDSLAGATRKAGSYQLHWDGRDEQGRPVPQGAYLLHLEIAREHGAHEKLSLPLQFQDGAEGNTSGQLELGTIQWQVETVLQAQVSAADELAGMTTMLKQ